MELYAILKKWRRRKIFASFMGVFWGTFVGVVIYGAIIGFLYFNLQLFGFAWLILIVFFGGFAIIYLAIVIPFLGSDFFSDDIARPAFGFRHTRMPGVLKFLCFQSMCLDMALLALVDMLRHIRFSPSRHIDILAAVVAKHKVELSLIGVEELDEFDRDVMPLIKIGCLQALTQDPPQVVVDAAFEQYFIKHRKQEFFEFR